MNMLLDALPETVMISGAEYPINSDFRFSIMFELLMQDTELADEEKIMRALELYYPQIPENIGGAIQALLWFYSCNAEGKRRKKRHSAEEREERRIYSFEYDDDYIYAAFMADYGIDLQNTALHWWKFRALFKSLSSDTEFVKIMGYRATQIDSDMSKKEKEFIRKMQSVHALPLPKDEEEKEDEIIKALQNGGDLSGIGD